VIAAPTPLTYTPRHISDQILAVRSAIEGERKHVSVLFCDIVSSSALAAELGPEDFHLVIDRFFRAALGEVHRYEGTINQFLGDGFMALFGAPIAHEDHARRAVLAALGIAAHSEVKIRIGINSGIVVVGTIGDDLRVDYTAFGDTTVLAARLQSAAAPGAVLVSEQTARLVRGYFELEDVPPVQVKERLVRPLRVTGLGARTSRIAVDDALSPFTGRDRELAELDRLLDVAAGGEGQVVGLVGDPGLGKSRLALEFRRMAGDRAAFLEGRCLSYGAGIAYLPLFDLVRNACGAAPGERPEAVAAKIEEKVKALELDLSLAGYLEHAFGVTAGDPGLATLDPRAIRARTFEALRLMLAAEARRRPLVVLVEDLHWIDQTSEDFLAEFAGDLASLPIMLLVTCRPGYPPRWATRSFATQIALRPLSVAASEQIVASILEAGDPEAAVIAGRGDGNPFFLEELARASRDQATGTAGAVVPETVQEVLAARIDRLSADQKAALQVAAVLGREFSLALAEEIWDHDAPLDRRLQELKALEFLRERDGHPGRAFMFRHALTREVAYDSLLQVRRRELHGRAGAALEESQADPVEQSDLLAYHYARSATPARAFPYLVTAGDRARDRYANEEAIAAYSQVISLIEELHGDARPGPYRAVCESLGTTLARLSRFDEAIDAFRKGLAVAHGGQERAHLYVLVGQAEEGAHRYSDALEQCDLAEEALGAASDPPGPEWLSSWLAVQDARMTVLYWLNDIDGLARLIERVRPLAEAHGSADQRMNLLFSIFQFQFRRDGYEVTDETLELARGGYAAAQQADPPPLWWPAFMLGLGLFCHGDLDEAEVMFGQSLREAERRGEANMRSRSLAYLISVTRMRGDADATLAAISPAIEQARQATLPEYEAMAVANRAWVAWRAGDEDRAAADAIAALEMWEGLPARLPFDWMALWPLLAMAVTARRTEQAVQYARGMLRPGQQLPPEPARAMVDGAVRAWEAGRPADAEQFLRRAVGAARDLGCL
jgi:class 3 adenylate cyclase/tetratricopeptide (TPR) repeat protein